MASLLLREERSLTMYKKTVEYEDFNGDKVKEDLYFNLSKAELLEMNFRSKGGLKNYIEAIINTNDQNALTDIFKSLLLKSFGIKSPDGRKFMKNAQIREEFECSIPYDIMFTTLSSDAKEAAAFVNGIIPKELAEEMDKVEMPEEYNQLINAINENKNG